MQPPHDVVQSRLGLDADTRDVRQPDVSVCDGGAVGEASERLEDIRVGLVAAEAETCGDVERHLVTAVRNAAAWRPRMLPQHLHDAEILHEPVRQRAIELQPVAVAAHPAVTNQVAGVLHREQVLAGGHRMAIVGRELGV